MDALIPGGRNPPDFEGLRVRRSFVRKWLYRCCSDNVRRLLLRVRYWLFGLLLRDVWDFFCLRLLEALSAAIPFVSSDREKKCPKHPFGAALAADSKRSEKSIDSPQLLSFSFVKILLLSKVTNPELSSMQAS
jgi:hypothetical protein